MSTIRSNEVDPLIYNFQHLTEYKNADVALQTLRRIASLVKPIMRQHNWKVGLLGEFFPKEKGLLGSVLLTPVFSLLIPNTPQVSTPTPDKQSISACATPLIQTNSSPSR
jgi:hypothetical protein